MVIHQIVRCCMQGVQCFILFYYFLMQPKLYQFLENNGKPAGRRVHHGAEVVCCPAQGERGQTQGVVPQILCEMAQQITPIQKSSVQNYKIMNYKCKLVIIIMELNICQFQKVLIQLNFEISQDNFNESLRSWTF